MEKRMSRSLHFKPTPFRKAASWAPHSNIWWQRRPFFSLCCNSMRKPLTHLHHLKSTPNTSHMTLVCKYILVVRPIWRWERLDFDIFVRYVKLVRKISNTEPLKSGIVKEVEPGLGCRSNSDIKGKCQIFKCIFYRSDMGRVPKLS